MTFSFECTVKFAVLWLWLKWKVFPCQILHLLHETGKHVSTCVNKTGQVLCLFLLLQATHNVSNTCRLSADEFLDSLKAIVEQHKIAYKQAGLVNFNSNIFTRWNEFQSWLNNGSWLKNGSILSYLFLILCDLFMLYFFINLSHVCFFNTQLHFDIRYIFILQSRRIFKCKKKWIP